MIKEPTKYWIRKSFSGITAFDARNTAINAIPQTMARALVYPSAEAPSIKLCETAIAEDMKTSNEITAAIVAKNVGINPAASSGLLAIDFLSQRISHASSGPLTTTNAK